MTTTELAQLKEAEDKVEFKAANGGNYSYNGASKAAPKDRRRCILGYVTAISNEGGGMLIFGMKDKHPHEVVGTTQNLNSTGDLEGGIYRDLRIRVQTEEIFDEQKRRVLIIHIPSRPTGKAFKFEDVALMRVGEDLVPMSDERFLQIIQEQEPDYSALINNNISLDDLDDNAVQKMKEAYARKQKNIRFLTLNKKQVLTDLDLVKGNKVTNAALILLGKRDILKAHLPQAAVSLEYRSAETLIRFDKRDFFLNPYYILLDELWNAIDARNGSVPVQQGPYIFDIPHFNKEVIREAVNNAVAHRDYRRQSEVVLKQYPMKLSIISPGGLPIGVNLQNIISVNSTPRNRLLAEVLSKTGIVERSGQGVDKIFYQCITEAKGEPNYGETDDFQVTLKLPGLVQDKAFALFINDVQNQRSDDDKLSVYDVITLDKIRAGATRSELDLEIVRKLLSEGLIEKTGRTNNLNYRLSKAYYSFTNQEAKYSIGLPLDENKAVMLIMQHLEEFRTAQMSDFAQLLDTFYTRDQTKRLIYKLLHTGFVERKGTGKGANYKLNKDILGGQNILDKAVRKVLDELNTLRKGDTERDKRS